MILIHKQFIDKARAAKSTDDVCDLLYGAVTLELSTLPPYLTGVFSLAPGANDEARTLVQSVVLEEMLHMALAANTAIAIGGNPPVAAPGLALRYPGSLPMSIDEGLTVTLGSLTLAQVQDVFMAIERPDTKATLPGEDPAKVQPLLTSQAARRAQGYGSIGDFYIAVIDALERLGPGAFANPRLERQLDLSRWFPSAVPGDPSCRVTDMNSARAALTTIMSQGEGTQIGSDPIDPYGGGASFAHYFKFGEIAFGHQLVRDEHAPSGWSYTGEAVPYDASKVYRFPSNATVSGYREGSAARIAAEAFYQAYVRLLRALDATFNGTPAMFDAALGVMFELKLLAQQVVQHPADPGSPTGGVAAPPFQP